MVVLFDDNWSSLMVGLSTGDFARAGYYETMSSVGLVASESTRDGSTGFGRLTVMS